MKKIWVIPCNVKIYDVMAHFQKSDTIYWRKSGGIRKGETVYVYIGAPRMAIMYRCVVEDDKVTPETMKMNSYALGEDTAIQRKYMKLKKEYDFIEPIPLKKMRALGLYMVRRQSRVYDDLYNYLEKQETEEKTKREALLK